MSICFSKIAGAPIGSPQFWESKEESMACALRRYGVANSGYIEVIRWPNNSDPDVHGISSIAYWCVR
jgi:hypothetical protein